MRRLSGMLMLALAAGVLIPAASAVAGVKAPASPVPQRFGVRLVDVPVSEAHNPRGLRYIIDYLPPGVVIHRRILVENQEPQTAHFAVYPDTAQIRQGSFIGDSGKTRSELTTWTSIQHPRLTLGPHASAFDMVTIRVPRTPTRGEHYGVIWVQQTRHARTARGFGINEVSRVGIRIYLAVGRGGAPPTNFTITSVSGHRSPHGQPSLTADVHNTGGRAVDISGTARLTGGPGGTSAGPFRVRQIITLAPGQSDDVTFVPPRRLPAGPWDAKISLVSGFTKHAATATITFSDHPAGALWTRPAVLIGALSFVLALLALLLGRRALRRRKAGLRRPELTA